MRNLANAALLLCLLSSLIPKLVFAAPPILILTETSNKSASSSLLPYIAFIEDACGKLSIIDVLSNEEAFSEQAKPFVNLGVNQKHRWLRFTVSNQTQDTRWYMEIGGSISSQIRVFAKDNDAFVEQKRMPRSILHRYRLALAPSKQTTIYIRIYDPKGVAMLSPTLYSEPQMLDSVAYRHAFYAFLMSGLLMLAAYNFLYFLYLRDTDFLTLAVCIAAYSLAMGNNAGLLHFFPWLTKSLAWNTATFLFLVIISGHHLGLNLLDIRRKLPSLAVWYYLGSIVGVISMIVALIYGSGLLVASLLGFYGITLILITLLKLFKQGYTLPKSLVVAILIFFIAGLPLILMAIGVIEHHPQMNDQFFIATLVSLLLLSLTQAEKIRLKREHIERTTATNEAKDEFLTTMSHELRTPMNAVVGAGRLLKLTALSSEQTEYVSRLNHSSEHMLSLVNDLLDLARVDHQQLQIEKVPFKLEEILNTLNQLLYESVSNKHLKLTLDNHFLPLNKHLIGDPTRLNQVLLNLLGNAIKFTNSGKVSLNIAPLEIYTDHVSLHFEVTDTGIGMTAAQQDRLFKPFAQAKSSTNRQYGGSGLGLAISHKLIKQMGGDLTVSSVSKQGSSFSFTLNFPLELSELSSEKKNQKLPKNLQEYKVLLIDDDEMNRFFGQKLLEVCGVEAIVAESGEAAISLLQQQPFDLVFMDISMPNIDGYEATRRIRLLPEFNNVIVIALTAHAVARERERCLAAGMDDYLTKPFELDDLQNIMIKWLPKQGKNAQLN